MASEPDRSALERIAEWANAEPGITVGSDGQLVFDGNPPLAIEVTADDESVRLIHTHVEASADAARIEAVRENLPARGAAVRGNVEEDGSAMTASLTATLYLDGLNRQAFVSTLNELVGAVDQAVGSVPTAAPSAPAEEEAPPSEAAVELSPETAPTLEVSRVWAPTHRVPEGGMRAWPDPDPALDSIANLQARVELAIAERRGDWAKVVGSNGWTGWVDARRLVEMGAGSAPAASPTATSTSFPIAALGAAAIAIAAFLPWFDVQGFSVNSFDIAMSILWDVNGSGNPALGYLVVAIAALGLAAIFLPNIPSGLRRLAGLVGLAVPVLFTYQVWQGFDAPFGDIVDAVGYGVYACLLGGLTLLGAPGGK